MPENYSEDMVFQLLGKTVFLCQQIEHAIKTIHACSTITIKNKDDLTIKDKVNAKLESKCTMGNTGSAYFKEVYSPPPENPGLLQMTYRRNGDRDIREKQFAEVVELRNAIVHTFSQEFDLKSEDSRKCAIDYQNSKYEIFRNEFDRMQFEIDFCRDAFNLLPSILIDPQFMLVQYLIQIHHGNKDKDGWTLLVHAGKRLREFSKPDYEVFSKIYRGKGLFNFIQTQECFETKRDGINCMYRVAPQVCENS